MLRAPWTSLVAQVSGSKTQTNQTKEMKRKIIGAIDTTPVGVRYVDRYGRVCQTQSSFAQLCVEAAEESDRDIWC